MGYLPGMIWLLAGVVRGLYGAVRLDPARDGRSLGELLQKGSGRDGGVSRW